MLRELLKRFRFHPRAWWDAFMTYPRFVGIVREFSAAGYEAEVEARLLALNRRLRPAKLPVPVGKRLLVLAPHPDDESIGCGGLLLLHRGCAEVHVINLFSGDGCGKAQDLIAKGVPADEARRTIAVRRRAELDKATGHLGVASLTCFGYSDGARVATMEHAARLREAVMKIKPDVVVLPWFLDAHGDHRMTNLLYAWGCADLDCMVLGYEIWSLTMPNAFIEITSVLDEKLTLTGFHETETDDIDYLSLVRGLAAVRGFERSLGPRRAGQAEAYLAMPNRDYCEVVRSLYGEPGKLTESGRLI